LRKIKATQIAAHALRARKTYLGLGANAPVCPFNLADSMGLDVRFVKIPSFEGMYVADEKVILISSLRPDGRKRFTCAHELGHHILRHGTVIDEIIDVGSDKEIEKEADFFAATLLMPASFIKLAAKDLDVNFDCLTAEKTYMLSKYAGVSFEALLTQLYYNYRLINRNTFNRLKGMRLAEIKKSIYANISNNTEVFIVGNWWKERAIDAVVGDTIFMQSFCQHEGDSISILSNDTSNQVFKCITPGISKIFNSEWSGFIRVCRPNYAGMYQYMHEEDVE
jgi:Zn-dependent peptidase ImmA (M78 family)